MATLTEHKAQVKLDKPEGTVKVNKNGVDTLLEGADYTAWVEAVAKSRLSDEQIGYKDDRSKQYKPIEEQLDLMYWDAENGTTTWNDHISKVKSDNPKP